MFVEEIFGDYAAFAPIIIMLISALILPAVHFAGKRHTVTWAVALVFAVISMAVNAYMLVDGFTGTTLGVYEYDADTEAAIRRAQGWFQVPATGVTDRATWTALTLLHCVAFFALEMFCFFHWLRWLECAAGSTLVTVLLVLTIEGARKR